jgi:hypothetical protein
MAHHPTPLKFLFPSWYAIVMGLCGLSLAWKSAVPAMGPMADSVSMGVGARWPLRRLVCMVARPGVAELVVVFQGLGRRDSAVHQPLPTD